MSVALERADALRSWGSVAGVSVRVREYNNIVRTLEQEVTGSPGAHLF